MTMHDYDAILNIGWKSFSKAFLAKKVLEWIEPLPGSVRDKPLTPEKKWGKIMFQCFPEEIFPCHLTCYARSNLWKIFS